MLPENFEELVSLIDKSIEKERTVMRDPIPARVKLAATIRFLSTGANYADLQHVFRIHKSTLSKFIPDVCDAIYTCLKEKYLKVNIYFFFVNAYSKEGLWTQTVVCLAILIICGAGKV